MSSDGQAMDGQTSMDGQAANDANTHDGAAEAGTDASADVIADHSMPPPPYGCVFPEGCDDVKV
jgi:hypothetical protein